MNKQYTEHDHHHRHNCVLIQAHGAAGHGPRDHRGGEPGPGPGGAHRRGGRRGQARRSRPPAAPPPASAASRPRFRPIRDGSLKWARARGRGGAGGAGRGAGPWQATRRRRRRRRAPAHALTPGPRRRGRQDGGRDGHQRDGPGRGRGHHLAAGAPGARRTNARAHRPRQGREPCRAVFERTLHARAPFRKLRVVNQHE